MKGVGVLDIICARRDFLNNGIYVRFNVNGSFERGNCLSGNLNFTNQFFSFEENSSWNFYFGF